MTQIYGMHIYFKIITFEPFEGFLGFFFYYKISSFLYNPHKKNSRVGTKNRVGRATVTKQLFFRHKHPWTYQSLLILLAGWPMSLEGGLKNDQSMTDTNNIYLPISPHSFGWLAHVSRGRTVSVSASVVVLISPSVHLSLVVSALVQNLSRSHTLTISKTIKLTIHNIFKSLFSNKELNKIWSLMIEKKIKKKKIIKTNLSVILFPLISHFDNF